jgi:hypothetical protein
MSRERGHTNELTDFHSARAHDASRDADAAGGRTRRVEVVPAAVAATLGVQLQPGSTMTESIVAWLGRDQRC